MSFGVACPVTPPPFPSSSKRHWWHLFLPLYDNGCPLLACHTMFYSLVLPTIAMATLLHNQSIKGVAFCMSVELSFYWYGIGECKKENSAMTDANSPNDTCWCVWVFTSQNHYLLDSNVYHIMYNNFCNIVGKKRCWRFTGRAFFPLVMSQKAKISITIDNVMRLAITRCNC